MMDEPDEEISSFAKATFQECSKNEEKILEEIVKEQEFTGFTLMSNSIYMVSDVLDMTASVGEKYTILWEKSLCVFF